MSGFLVKRSECTCSCHRGDVQIRHIQACCQPDEVVEEQREYIRAKLQAGVDSGFVEDFDPEKNLEEIKEKMKNLNKHKR